MNDDVIEVSLIHAKSKQDGKIQVYICLRDDKTSSWMNWNYNLFKNNDVDVLYSSCWQSYGALKKYMHYDKSEREHKLYNYIQVLLDKDEVKSIYNNDATIYNAHCIMPIYSQEGSFLCWHVDSALDFIISNGRAFMQSDYFFIINKYLHFKI